MKVVTIGMIGNGRNMKTGKELGRHAEITYCIQISKTDDNKYFPRLVFLFDTEIILEPEDLFMLLAVIEFDFNPIKIMRQFVVGFIDAHIEKLKEDKNKCA